MINFEAFCQIISPSINHLFLKSMAAILKIDCTLHCYIIQCMEEEFHTSMIITQIAQIVEMMHFLERKVCYSILKYRVTHDRVCHLEFQLNNGKNIEQGQTNWVGWVWLNTQFKTVVGLVSKIPIEMKEFPHF